VNYLVSSDWVVERVKYFCHVVGCPVKDLMSG
jgi:hypothetical protein